VKKIILILLILFGISACDKHSAQENLDLGLSYYKGDKNKNIEQDYDKAFKFLKKSTNQGNLDAQYKLAGMYLYGTGVKRDSKKGMDLYEDAAEKGHIQSQITIGNAYLAGDGVPKDFDKAVQWFTRAADQNDYFATFLLGLIHQNVDNKKSLEWYKKASVYKEDKGRSLKFIKLFLEK